MPVSQGGNTGTVAVIGATGQQGGAVARHLLARGAAVRALVRDPGSERAVRVRNQGASVVRADLADPASLVSALRGADTLFAMTTFAEDGPAGEVRQGRAIGDAAREAGVSHVVYSSVGGADRATGIPHFESKWAIEEHLREAGLNLTVIRPVFFMDNLRGAARPEPGGDERVFRFPLAPGVPLQMISVEDIGAIGATAVLLPDSIPGGQLEIAADQLTPEQIAEAFSERTGQKTRFEAVDIAGITDDDQRAMFEWFTQVPAYRGDFTRTSALRQSPLRFADYLRTL
ncbi:NmrA/HSCARG family protein [Kineosporia sp. J2-2]|uniref:NmrA/HSCARG family protein n=1 Tax=Kineosporia corallincola TaxID=2835133 RepID=A0ABS5TEC8_9ACTN|nr:NmrA/HSCARG family protein [Kineosporia corallincola]MBT0769443.1 NmrA/HSCARG family protein [Kineosporia corallincola]